MTESYFDSLAECVLMVGVNEMTGLKVSKQNSLAKTENECKSYQQNILAAVSSSVAMFPFSKQPRIYPPQEFRKYESKAASPLYSSQGSQEERQVINDFLRQYSRTELRDKHLEHDLTSNFNRRNSKFQSRRKSVKSLETYKGSLGSISIDTIKAFPATYFNNNLKISPSYIEPKFEILPMTDNLGNRSYAFRLEFYRHFMKISSQDQDPPGDIEIQPVKETDIDSEDYIYLPCNIVFFSKYPFFNLFRDVLSQLFSTIHSKNTSEIEEDLLEYCAILTRIPVMMSENIKISFSIDDKSYCIRPINPIFNQMIDWDTSILFQLLSLDDIIFIIVALFQEQKLAFFSQYPNIVTIACETILVLFQPFTWKHFYLTVVPSHLYELVDAIFPFIMGLPHQMKEKVIKSYNDIIVIDLDEGSISVPQGLKIENISKDLINQLKQKFKNRDWLSFRDTLSDLGKSAIKDWRESSFQVNKKFFEKAMLNFMVLMVDLFHDILLNITVEKPNDKILVANLDKFLRKSHSKNIPFFRSIYRSDGFNCFLDSKIRKMETDCWVEICVYRHPSFRDHFRLLTSKAARTIYRKVSKSTDVEDFFDTPVEESFYTIHLPTNRQKRQDYYKTVLNLISRSRDIKNMNKLEIEMYLQMGNKEKGLELMYKTLSDESTSLSYSKIRRLIQGLDKVGNLSFINSLKTMVRFDERQETTRVTEKHHVEQFYPPTVQIPKNLFFEICKNADITEFESTAEDLFKSLTIEQKSSKKYIKHVSPELFKCFYDNWIQFSTTFDEEEICINEILDEILIISTNSPIKVDDYGNGKLVLTQMRLLLIPSDGTPTLTLANFLIEKVEMKRDRKIKGFTKLADVLEIVKGKNSKKIVIRMLDDFEIWYNLISEVIYGNRLSIEERDKVIPDKMTEQCIIYENLATCAKTHPYFKRNLNAFSKIMLTFITSHLDDNKHISYEHRKYLVCKITPSPNVSITIDCILIIYKPLLKNFDLCCAFTTGDKYFIRTIHVINDSLQSIDPCEMEFMSRIKFMLCLIGTNKVVIACANGSVFMMNSMDYAIEEIKIFNNSEVLLNCGISFYASFNRHIVYFGTSTGELIKWSSEYQKTEKIMQIPKSTSINFMQLYDMNTFVLGSAHYWYIVNIKGEILSSGEVSNVTTILNRISFMSVLTGSEILVLGLARLPIVLEYNLTDIRDPQSVRKRNWSTNKDMVNMDITGNSESSSKYVGISSVLSVKTGSDETIYWVIYRDGEVDIRKSNTFDKLSSFNAHSGGVTEAHLCELQNQKYVLTVGKEDGKVILWKTTLV